MTISNCIDCGKVFVKNTQDNACPECYKVWKIDLEKISFWLSQNDSPSLKNIEEEIGVTEENFKKYLLEGKVRVFNHVLTTCMLCGNETTIRSKKFLCKECTDAFIKKAQTIEAEKKKLLEDSKLYSKNKWD